MNSVNKIIIIGRLGLDPEGISFPDGSMIAKLSIATSERWTDKKTGQSREHTEWHKVIAHGVPMTDFAMVNFKKGSLVCVEGSIKHRTYQDNQNITRYVTEIHAEFIQSFK